MQNNTSSSTVIIIGGGFSGIMVAANLIRKTKKPLNIFIVEKTSNFGKGVAYSTPQHYHLLNVPASNMGAYAEDVGHFLSWLEQNQSIWRQAIPEFANLPIEASKFYPRKLYGIYLEHVFKAALEDAQQKGIKVTIIKDEAVDVEITDNQTAVVKLKKSKLPEAYHVVIATGTKPVKSFAFAHGIFLCNERYIENMWGNVSSGFFASEDLSYLPESTNIAIVGTGLTMVDAFLSLCQKGYKGKITAISRHGKLPHPHKNTNKYPEFIDLQNYPKSAYGLFKTIHKEAKKAIKEGQDWRSVIQSLRPITNDIWAKLTANERRYIIKNLMSYWNIHRHRVPAEVYNLLQEYIASGRLNIIPGTIYYIGGRSDAPLMVSYRKRGADVIESMPADYVINCSGPEADIAKSGNQFLLNLRDKGLISVGTLRMGIELNKTGRVRGKSPDIFYAAGSLLVGEKIESTAVPDIRVQALDIAINILSDTRDEDYKNYSNYLI